MGWNFCLKEYGGFQVDGEAGDLQGAIRLAQSTASDVAIVDTSSPAPDGFAIAEKLHDLSPSLRIALVAATFTSRDLKRGVALKVNGFLLKSELPRQLADFLREIHESGYCCSDAVREALRRNAQGFTLAAPDPGPLESLTAEELRILIELANGSSLKQAAQTIGMPYKAADRCKQRLMKKLDIHTSVQLCRFAMREGLVC